MPDINIKYNDHSIASAFNDHYIVPDYQREYVWKDEQVEQLLADLLEAYEVDNKKPYFLGTIVTYNTGSTFELIDGQQRLTTFFLMLCAVKHLYKKLGEQTALVENLIYSLTMDSEGNQFHSYHLQLQYDTSKEKDGILREDQIYSWLSNNNDQCQYEEKPFQFVEKMKHDVNLYVKYRKAQGDDAGNMHLKNVTMLAGNSYKLHLMLMLAASEMDEEALSKFKEVVESVVYYTVINRITTNITERTFASWCSEIRRITSAESLDAFVARAVIPTVTSWKQDNQSNFMRLGLNSMQQYRIKFILGKITAYVDALRQGTSTVRDVTPYVQSTVEIEHIMPQTCYDKGQYGLSEEEYPVYLNRLGNLTLLENSINKSIQNEGYEAKAKAYKQSKFYLTSALSELTDQGSQTAINRTNKILRAWTAWDKGSIEDRQLLLYELSERIWSITKKQES